MSGSSHNLLRRRLGGCYNLPHRLSGEQEEGMLSVSEDNQTTTLTAIRFSLMVILVTGLVGTGTELLLMEHTDGLWQLVPLVLIVMVLAVLCWAAFDPGSLVVRVFQGTLLLVVLSGVVGCILHYQGNVEFELEMYPSRKGMELFWESIPGATPSLAPGIMITLGLVGLAYTYRHPRLGRSQGNRSRDKGEIG